MYRLTTLLLAAAVAVGGCAALKPGADVATAAVELPVCRIQLVQYMGDDMFRIAPELERLDGAFERVLAAVKRRPDITLDGAINYGLGVTAKADALEADWQAVRAGVAAVVSERDGVVPANLAGCADRTEAGWQALRGNEGATSAATWLQVYGPLAKAGLLLLL